MRLVVEMRELINSEMYRSLSAVKVAMNKISMTDAVSYYGEPHPTYEEMVMI